MADETTPPERPKRKPPNRLTPRPSRAKAVKAKPGPKPKPKPEPAPTPKDGIGPDQSAAIKKAARAKARADAKAKAETVREVGRPAHVPDVLTRRLVETHAASATPEKVIAGYLGISENTLRKHYTEELTWGRHRLISRVAALVIQAALKGCKTRQLFILRTIGGPQWRPGSDLHHSGPNGQPLLPAQEMVPLYTETLTIEEVQLLRRVQHKIAVTQGVVAIEAESDDAD